MEAGASAKSEMRKIYYYVLGIVLLGLLQEWLRGVLGEIASFAIAIVYLLFVRFVAEKLGR